jgi:hypothetical protein
LALLLEFAGPPPAGPAGRGHEGVDGAGGGATGRSEEIGDVRPDGAGGVVDRGRDQLGRHAFLRHASV